MIERRKRGALENQDSSTLYHSSADLGDQGPRFYKELANFPSCNQNQDQLSFSKQKQADLRRRAMLNRSVTLYIRSAQKLLIRLNMIASEATEAFLFFRMSTALSYIQLLCFILLNQVLPIFDSIPSNYFVVGLSSYSIDSICMARGEKQKMSQVW